MLNLFAAAGPLTAFLGDLATTIASGLVVGSFVAGLRSLVFNGSRVDSEESSLIGGYFGGAVALGLLALDIVGRRFV